MPIYEYKCKRCRRVTEKFYPVNQSPERVKCACGKMAKKIISRGAIKCDSINDVKWLPSAREALQPDCELRTKPIETRGQYNKYLKDNNLVCKG